ncbi:MAG: hypothetical protein GY835_09105 [bacterium]|nr:hypothetical protein [bacterium]
MFLVNSLVEGKDLFFSRANGEGCVEPPRSAAGGYLLVKHPAAAFLIREWLPRVGESELSWDLPAASDRPLLIHVKDAWGEDAVPNAELALWVDGWRLSGRTLAWLTGAPGRADRNGFWTVTNLPRDTVAVLAWELRMRDEAYAGRLDSQAVDVEYPWPESVEIHAIQ